MQDMCGVVEFMLEGPVQVREGFGAAAEAEGLAEIVATLGAVVARVAHDSSLDCDALAYGEAIDTFADRGDDACCFMAEDERRLKGKVAVSTMDVVVNCVGC